MEELKLDIHKSENISREALQKFTFTFSKLTSLQRIHLNFWENNQALQKFIRLFTNSLRNTKHIKEMSLILNENTRVNSEALGYYNEFLS